MASLRDIRKRIRSVKSTQKITRAMKLVSASKLRRAQAAIVAARPYAEGLRHLILRVAEGTDQDTHPLLDKRMHTKRALVIVFTSDRGQAGAFNANAIRAGERFMAEHKGEYEEVQIATIGRRGRDYFKRKNIKLRDDYPGIFDGLKFTTAKKIAEELAQAFTDQNLDAVYFVYNEFKSAMTQIVQTERLLPIAPEQPADAQPADESLKSSLSFEYEPDEDKLLEMLLPQYLATQVWRALLESVASEHGARMSAMESATKNASEMIDRLTLVYNRARQAAITKELMEIVSGAEAQKG